MVMGSEMLVVAQLVASRPILALLTPFCFGLDFHAFVLKLLQDHCVFQGDIYLGTELGAASDSTCCHLLCL